MRWWRKYRAWILGFLVVLLIGVWIKSRGNGVDYNMARVERQDVVQTLVAAGRVKADQAATLNYPANGKLWFINVKVGDRVRKGQSLSGVDPRAMATSEQNAYFAYLAADANAKQIEDEVKGHDNDETFVLRNKRVAAQAARDRAYFLWRQAVVDRQNTVLVAPFPGVVTGITSSVVGDTVGVTDGITIVDPDSLYFELELDEEDVDKVIVGQGVDIDLDARPNQTLKGKISVVEFGSRVGETGATIYAVKVDLDRTEGLRMDFNGDATLTLAEAKGVLVLPVDAVKSGKVKVLDRGKVKEIAVVTGLENDLWIEIKEGLDLGQEVLVD